MGIHNIKIGDCFGRFTVMYEVEQKEFPSGQKLRVFRCECSCGNIKDVLGNSLVRALSKSCGCLHKEQASKRRKSHGEAIRGRESVEYIAWSNAKARCYIVNNTEYKNYGGRGIIMCDRWKNSYENFLSDMGRKPHANLTLERKNVDGNYEPSNCIWDTWKAQRNNQRRSHSLTKVP